MRGGFKSFLFGAVLGSLFFVGCSQSGENVPIYQYNGEANDKSFGVHTVQSGENLWAISQAYRVELRDMLDLNHLSPPYLIKAGTRINIPVPRSYIVQSGDTLYRVSRIFDTTTTELARLNRIKSPYVLSKGQSLRLPGAKSFDPPVFSAEKNAPQMVGSRVTVGVVKAEKRPENSAQPTARTNKTPSKPIQKAMSLPTRSSSGFLMPVSGRVVSSFGAKKDGLHNDGINIKAARGTAVRAAENGSVAYVGDEIDGYGNLILLRHSGGYITAYAHLEKLLVKKGDNISRGQAIGTVGSSGRIDSPQLHFEIRRGKKAINPETLVRI